MASADARDCADAQPVVLRVSTVPAEPSWPSPRRAWLIMILLLTAYVLGFIDRQVLNLLAPAIKADLDLTDTQVGLLQGPAFAATYVLFSFPLGWLSDSMNRMRLLAFGAFFWTLATMACGFARNAWQLGIARAGVGAGEAAIVPAAWSILADSFPTEKRATPVSIYLAGPYIGGSLALIFGAVVLGLVPEVTHFGGLELANWQMVFILVAAPGLLLGLVFLVVRDPDRQLASHEKVEKRSFRDFLAFLKSHWKIYAGMWLGMGLYVVLLYGIQAATPTYLVRAHGWEIGEAGYRYGIIVLLAGTTSVLSAPVFHRWILKRTGRDHALTISAGCGILIAPFGFMIPFADENTVLPLLVILSFLVTVPLPLNTTTLQLVTPNFFRGRASAVTVIATNVLGLGLGPTMIGVLTDYVFEDLMLIGHSMAVLFVFFGLTAAACFLIGAKSLADTSPLSTKVPA